MQVRCLHCHEPTEVPDDSDLGQVTCSVCGGSFSLVGGEQTGTYVGESRTLAHFELIEQVGVGAFGSVWKARDTKLERTVAVKIPRKGQLNPKETEQFLREARAAAQLKHPNIVSVHEVGRADDTVYIVSDFVQGATLDDWLTDGRLTPRETAELCTRIAEALHHAHEARVIHRDLKPSNVMLDLAGRPHLLDFGLARREVEATMTVEGRILGTPAYMSPEQARGEAHSADRRTDIYSLGVILFRLLTGELPFRGNAQMLVVQILRDDPPSPRKLDARVPRDLETICLKCLEKDPKRRYPTALAVAAELERFSKGEPIQARPILRVEKLWRWSRRNRAVAALTAGLLLLLLVLAIGGPLMAVKQARLANEESRAREDVRVERDDARRARDELRDTLYAADLNLIQAAWEADNVARVLELLDRQVPKRNEPDLRGFEWHYWRRQCNSDLRTMNLVGAPVGDNFAMAELSADASRCFIVKTAFELEDTVGKIWETKEGREILTLPKSGGDVLSFRFSRDGSLLAWIDQPSSPTRAFAEKDQLAPVIHVWDTQHRKPLIAIPLPKPDQGADYTLDLSGDGSRVAACTKYQPWAKPTTKREIRVWETRTGKEVALIPSDGTWGQLAFNSDGSRLAVEVSDFKQADFKVLRIPIWDVDARRELVSLEGTEVTGHSVRGIVFSPDDTRIASAAVKDGLARVCLWDAKTGKQLLSFTETATSLWQLRFSPNGKALAGAGGPTVRLYDTGTGKLRRTLKGHTHNLADVAFTPDGRRTLSLSFDGVVKVWDATVPEDPAPAKDLPDQFFAHRTLLSPDGTRVIRTPSLFVGPNPPNKHEVRLFDLGGKELRSFSGPGEVTGIACNYNATRLLVVAEQTGKDQSKVPELRAWETTSGRELFTVQFPEVGDQVVSLGDDPVVSRDGTLVAVAYSLVKKEDSPELSSPAPVSAGGVKILDFVSGKQLPAIERASSARWHSVALSPDSKRVAAVCGHRDRRDKPEPPADIEQQGIFIWDVATRQLLLHVKSHASHLVFSPDGKLLAGVVDESVSQRATIKLWNASDGKEVTTLKGHFRFIGSITFSRDGRRIVAFGNSSGLTFELKLWDTASGRELLSLPTNRPLDFNSIVFGPNNHRLIFAGSFMDSPGDLVQILDATPLPAGRDGK